MNRSLVRLAGLLFLSGFCALVYQSAWLRSLRLVFGASTAATAAVLGIFMAGLGFGGLILGRRADRHSRPLELYARLEAGIAISAALSPLLIDLARAAYLALGGTSRLGFALGTAARLGLAALILGGPAFLMGGTLPAMARAAETSADAQRRRVGLLYGWNTIGAVLGVLATTFWLIELVGVRRSIWLAAPVNLLIAVAARALARSQDGSPVEAGTAVEAAAGRARRRFVLASAFAVGFVFLSMELVWYRMMAPLLGGSTYTFGIVLAVALAGIGLGGLLFSLASPREAGPRTFALSCALEALLLAAPFALGDRLADFALGLRVFAGWGFLPLVLAWSVIAAAVVFLPAVVAGYQFPLLIALLGRGERAVGSEVGAAYAWNTLGAIAGSLAGGFGLMPLLSAPGLWRAAVLALVALALGAIAFEARSRRIGTGSLAGAGALLAVALAAAPGPSAAWRHRPIGAGRVALGEQDANQLRRQANAIRRSVSWEADGREASVALQSANGYAFVINGKSDGHAIHDADTQVMGGLVGAVLHPDPRSALVIGLGTGSTAGWLAAVPSIERVDVAEIEPAIVHVARACTPVNHGALDDPKVRVLLDDAREVLQTSRSRYDIVLSEPSNPYRVGISSLFSREFYARVRERLGPSGVFLQWLQGYEIDAELVRTVYATLGSVFPSVETWQVGKVDLLLVASAEPIEHDFERAASRLAAEPLRSALAWTWGVEGLAGFYAGHVATPAFAAAVAASAAGRIERDDRPLLEFGFVHNLGRTGEFSIPELRALARERGESLRGPGAPSPHELADALGVRMLAEMASPSDIAAASFGDASLAARTQGRRAWAEGRLADGLWPWNGGAVPRHPIERTLLSESLALGGEPRALELLPAVREISPAEADLIEGLYRSARGDAVAASESYANGFRRMRESPWAYQPLVERSLLRTLRVVAAEPRAAGTIDAALAAPFAVRAFDELRLRVRLELVKRGDFRGGCRAALARFEAAPPWEEPFLRDRHACHLLHGGAGLARATADLEEFLSASPPRLSDWQLDHRPAPTTPGSESGVGWDEASVVPER
ncbi:MAG TPA: fused MFS/spermidine synthase [Thermoanaerobaculia bacterium]|nr:fused MFS/spermidine synthase [Thermoanaerobaculia bacterium]